jgi:hypothetical protein
LMILAEQRIDEDDIKKTIELCEMMVYYHNRTKHG